MDQSIETQRSDLRRYCDQRGFEIFREFADEGVSGTKDRRPALDALMEGARKRLFDTVLCWRFDRFARSTKHLISALDEFRHLGIEFISYQENIDTSSPLGKAVFTIVAVIAELERNIIVERIRGGIRRAREQGKKLGRRPFSDPGLLRTVLQMKAQGKSIRVIAEAVRCRSPLSAKPARIPFPKSSIFQPVKTSRPLSPNQIILGLSLVSRGWPT